MILGPKPHSRFQYKKQKSKFAQVYGKSQRLFLDELLISSNVEESDYGETRNHDI